MRAAFALIAVLATAAFAAPAAAQTSGSTVPFSTTLPAPIDRAHLIAMFQRTTNVLDYGADPTGVADSAPAFRAAIGSNRRIIVPPGTYRFSSVQPAGCCAMDPGAVIIKGLDNFEIDGYGATIVADPSIALSGLIGLNTDTNFVIRGLAFQGSRAGLSAGQENTAIGFNSTVNGLVQDLHIGTGFGGNGAAIAGDWIVNMTIQHVQMDGVGHCFDLAYLKDVRIADIKATGADATGSSGAGQTGMTCFSAIVDPPNAAQNFTGVSYNETANVTITGLDESNFNTGGLINTGTNWTLYGNRWHDNPGGGNVAGIGLWIQNSSGSSAGVPPQNITISDIFENNGTGSPGTGLNLTAGGAASGDVLANVSVIGSQFINNTHTGIGTDGVANFSNIIYLANQFSGAAQTVPITANAAAIATISQQGGALSIGGTLTMPNNAAILAKDNGGNPQPMIYLDTNNETVIRPPSGAGDINLQDYSGNILAQFFAGGNAVTKPTTFSGGATLVSTPVTSSVSTAYIAATGNCGTTIRFVGAQAEALTVPTGLPVGCRIRVAQIGGGAVTFSAGSGMTMEAYNGATAILGQNGAADVFIDSASTFQLSGQVH